MKCLKIKDIIQKKVLNGFGQPKKIKNIIKNHMICHEPSDRLGAMQILQILN